jgi:D-alanine-D-alanine ligase
MPSSQPTAKTSSVAVVFGGPSPEHDVSILTGLQATHELLGSSREVLGVYWSKAGTWYLVDPSLEAATFAEGVPRGAEELDLVASPGGGFVRRAGRFGRQRPLGRVVVVNCCHGGPGEDGTLQGALDLAGVPYTGPSASGAALGMDKLSFGALVAHAGLPTLDRVVLRSETSSVCFEPPYIVKPRFGGSSIGIDVVADLDTAKARLEANPHLRRGAVIEPYRNDLFDLNIAIRTWPCLELSAIERPLKRTTGSTSGEILGYLDKYAGGEGMASAPRELPAKIDSTLAKRVKEAATELAYLSSARGISRVDFLTDGHDLFVNEVNTVPGSLARYLWIDPPIPFSLLLEDMIAEAIERPAAERNATGADGSLLKSAGSIAAKLA